MQKEAALYEIEGIEKTFHKAATTHNVNLMMSLFAPGAVFNIGTETYTGKAQIRKFFATKNEAFMPQNHWQADTPSYRIKATVNGDKGTLYFECDYIDVKTGKVMATVGVDHEVQKINGKWLILDSAAAPTSLSTKAGEADGAARGARGAAPPGGGRRSSDRTTGSSARSPARPRTSAPSCSSRSSRSPRCSSSSASSVCASSASRTPGSSGSAPSSCDRRPTRRCRLRRTMLRQLLALRVGGDPGAATITGAAARGEDGDGRSSTRRSGSRCRSSGPSTSEATYGFVPPPADERMLERIRRDYHNVRQRALTGRRARRRGHHRPQRDPAAPAAQSTPTTTCTRSRTISPSGPPTRPHALIAANRSAYTSSRDLFIGVGAISVALAAGLGLILSWALIGPIQRMEARLAEIAAGDFSGRVDVPNRDELGSLAANLNRMNDELRRLYGELETASRHKSEFLANMSHELRTPLNAIIGFSQVLQQRLFGEINAKQEEYLDDILSSGNHLLSLINDVLDLSKVEAGQVELEVAAFSLREALERGVVMVRERAAENGVGLSVELAPDVDIVDGDERRIRQVVFNLLSNAVKFTPAGGSVTVAAARVDGEVQVSVADTGPGSRPKTRSGSSRSSSRRTSAWSSARAPGSAWRSRGASSSFTAAGSGSRASQGKAAVSSSPSRSEEA